MSYARGDLYTYISAFRVEKGAEFTHTSFTKPGGAFYLPSEETEKFFSIYEEAVLFKEDLYLMEKHRDISPILIDLDFRFDKSSDVKRKYTLDTIKDIVELYITKIKNYINLDKLDIFNVVILEKSSPVKGKDIIKDGIHIIFPEIVTKPTVQYMIRKDVISDIEPILSKMGLKNPIEDIIDEAVIERNNWILYGSKKPEGEAYNVTHVFTYKPNAQPLCDFDGIKSFKKRDFVQFLSIRNKYDSLPIKKDKQKIVKEFESNLKKKISPKNINPALQMNKNTKKTTCDNIEFVEKLVDILSIQRAESYQDWIRVGWCLRNVDHRLLPKWIDFSQKSSKFEDGACEKFWNFMKEDGLGIGTLHMWAKNDSPNEYRDLCKNDLMVLIYKSVCEAHTDVARVVHYMFRYSFVCVSIKNNAWYEFRNHRWMPCDSGFVLRSKISDDVFREYSRQASYYSEKASNETIEADQHRWAEIAKKLNIIALKLKQTSFKDNIMKECREQFYVERFEEKLDSRCYLVGFENGIYDLDAEEFRDGRPEDYVSFSTNTHYELYDKHSDETSAMHEFISKIFTNNSVKEYVLHLISSFLNGNIREEKFHVWTGSGCHKIDTDIMMYNGHCKRVQDIRVGDQLMGDDSTPRNVLHLFQGYSEMYNICAEKWGDEFVVNGDHVLSLIVTQPSFKIYDDESNMWCIKWMEYCQRTIIKKCKMDFVDEEFANEFLENISEKENTLKHGDIVDISVNDFRGMNLSHLRFSLFKKDIELKDSTVHNDAWLFGFKLNLLIQTHIPSKYVYNLKVIRYKILAGIIDQYYQNNIDSQIDQYAIVVNKYLAYDIIQIIKSLNIEYNYSSNTETLILFGDGIENIPVIIANSKTSIHGDKSSRFSIKLDNDDNFYGFELDGNHRYLMGNYIVTHNSNGKSKFIELFERSFGDYCVKFPITLLTQKRAASNAATSELARAKGKRFAALQEPSEDEKLNIGLMKELSGGDKIMARLIYREPIEFKPQFKMILACNHLPVIPSDDGGTWRRIRVVEFTSKFCESPNPDKRNEFAMDMELSTKFDDWKDMFISLLIEYYKSYKKKGIVEPEEVMRCTREYQRSNDGYLDFVESELEPGPDGSILECNDLYACFKVWVNDNAGPHFKGINKKTFTAGVSKVIGETSNKQNPKWKGWTFKNKSSDVDLID